MTPDSDQRLVKAMLAGDERAFRMFFDAYFPRVYRFALPRLASDIEATKEVVQATLTKSIRKLDTFRADAALFLRYLVGSVKYVAMRSLTICARINVMPVI
jgi:RNA polymerase sigma-70 factor, ECF subfamily